MDLSIVTISMNHARYLRGLCASVDKERNEVDLEMILIDNCSSDETQAIIRDEFPWVRLLVNKHVRNFSYNNNKGIHYSKGRFVLALNPDIFVFPGSLKVLMDFMKDNPQVGICGPKLLNADMSIQPSCRRYSTPIVLLLRGLRLDIFFPKNKLIDNYLMTNLDRNIIQDVEWLLGAALLIRRQALDEVEGFDENYPLYFEDQDLCRRMWKKGWRITFVPQSKMIHYYARESANSLFSKKTRMHYRSMMFYLYKFYFSNGLNIKVSRFN